MSTLSEAQKVKGMTKQDATLYLIKRFNEIDDDGIAEAVRILISPQSRKGDI